MKDFDGWNEIKKQIDRRYSAPEFREGDVWWCQLGVNVGFEENGKNTLVERPVLILRKYGKELFFGLPMTSNQKNTRFYYSLAPGRRKGAVILSQGRALSPRHLLRRLFFLSSEELQRIQTLHSALLGGSKTAPQY
jgi:mRNA-degrading endonuclease toxin of MazEF toxin-antitoxin module